MRFTDDHAPGAVCHPSRYGLMTGAHPFRTDTTVWPKQPLIKSGQMTIAPLLKTAGYHTAMVGKWHLGFDEPRYDGPLRGGPVDRGFAGFFAFRASTDIAPYFYIKGDHAVAGLDQERPGADQRDQLGVAKEIEATHEAEIARHGEFVPPVAAFLHAVVATADGDLDAGVEGGRDQL